MISTKRTHDMNALPEGFEWLGWYGPAETGKLLAALEDTGIQVYAEFHDGTASTSVVEAAYGGNFGALSQVLVAVETARRQEADVLHARLFGAGLPAATFGGNGTGGSDEEWDPDRAAMERSLLERREALSHDLAAVERQLGELKAEIEAAGRELGMTRLHRARREALRRAIDRNRSLSDGLAAARTGIVSEVRRINAALAEPP